jgi:hypothetical protein
MIESGNALTIVEAGRMNPLLALCLFQAIRRAKPEYESPISL